MGIKEMLAEEDAGFISLRQLLTEMVRTESCSLEQAAAILYRRLKAENGTPDWVTYTLAEGIKNVPWNGSNAPEAALLYVIDHGNFYKEMEDDIPF